MLHSISLDLILHKSNHEAEKQSLVDTEYITVLKVKPLKREADGAAMTKTREKPQSSKNKDIN